MKILNIYLFVGALIVNASAPLMAQQHVLKLTLTDLVIVKLSGSYEYAFNDQISLNINGGWLPERDLFVFDAIIDTDETDFSDDFFLGGISVAPELRFYFGGNAPNGFFLGPYLVYSSYGVSSEYNYFESNTNQTIVADATGFLNSFGGGLLLGYQWILRSNVALDLFLGLGGTSSRLGISVNDDRLSEVDLVEIADEIEDELDFLFFDFDVDIEDDGVRVKAPGVPLPNARFGFAIGYSF